MPGIGIFGATTDPPFAVIFATNSSTDGNVDRVDDRGGESPRRIIAPSMPGVPTSPVVISQ